MSTLAQSFRTGFESTAGMSVRDGVFGIIPTFIFNIADGFLLVVLWQWFVVDAFGIEEINIPQAMGLILIGRLIIRRPYHDDKPRALGDILMTRFAALTVTFVTGYILYTFFM